MQKVYLQQVRQYNKVFYTGKFDPRVLVELADDVEVGDVQDSQRPLEKKHINELSEYVGDPTGNGILPTSVLLSTRERLLMKFEHEEVEIKHADGTIEKTILHYILMPETKDELNQYKGTIDIIDGQHRLFSFKEIYRSPDLKDSDHYEITFSLFDCPDLFTRRMLFMVTNEKQKAVNGNFLLYLREKLQLLSDDEKRFYPLITALNKENMSPLKGRIVMSAEKIPKGYKSRELIKILKRSIPNPMVAGGHEVNQNDKLRALSIYLSGWEAYYHYSFSKPGKETMTKISGLRYILLLFPTFWNHSLESLKKFDKEYVKAILDELQTLFDYHDGESPFDNSLNFRGEGATVKFASNTSESLKVHLTNQATNGFDPFA